MDFAHLHFLVAQADALQRRSLVDMLGQMGAPRVTEAADGHTALRFFQNTFTPNVNIAIIDLALPGIDGLELIRTLAAMASNARLVIVGNQSANLMFAVETMAQAYGVDLLGTLSTPVSAQRLAELLEIYGAPVVKHENEDGQGGPRFSFSDVGIGLKARQFEPFFQPKIELETGQVKGLEAFARWRHPEHGVLGPGAFMDALEQHGRIDFLDWSMIEKSVERCRSIHDMGIPIAISINLAPATLAHPQFLQQMAACVNRHRILPDYITFEIPESSVLATDAGFVERLVRLRIAGYGLAIDDYGTGPSNLQLLARIPFSELKIDRSFVDGASKKRALGVVLSSCLGLARSLDRASVAVGVETKQDWDFLQALGCTYAQGYYIAKPMPVEEFPAWLADWQHFF